MTKPRLVKVRALFYVLQHVMKRGCAYFDTASYEEIIVPDGRLPFVWRNQVLAALAFRRPKL